MASVTKRLSSSSTESDIEEQARFTRTWLSKSTKPWVAVFDNYDVPDTDIEKHIPTTQHGIVKITSRHHQINNLAEEKF